MINDALILIIYENIGKMDNSTVIKRVNNNEFVFFATLTCLRSDQSQPQLKLPQSKSQPFTIITPLNVCAVEKAINVWVNAAIRTWSGVEAAILRLRLNDVNAAKNTAISTISRHASAQRTHGTFGRGRGGWRNFCSTL